MTADKMLSDEELEGFRHHYPKDDYIQSAAHALLSHIDAQAERIDLRTSEEWMKYHPEYTVMDPDGWDRKNFEESWSEKITLKEFTRRLMFSTCSFGPSYDEHTERIMELEAEVDRLSDYHANDEDIHRQDLPPDADRRGEVSDRELLQEAFEMIDREDIHNLTCDGMNCKCLMTEQHDLLTRIESHLICETVKEKEYEEKDKRVESMQIGVDEVTKRDAEIERLRTKLEELAELNNRNADAKQRRNNDE